MRELKINGIIDRKDREILSPCAARRPKGSRNYRLAEIEASIDVVNRATPHIADFKDKKKFLFI